MKYWIDTNWGQLSVTDPSAFRVLNAFGQQTGKYNPVTCRNGGGYWQMEGSCFVRSGNYTFFVETWDDSCGDFYTEQGANVHVCDARIAGIEVPKYAFLWHDEFINDSRGFVERISKYLGVGILDVIKIALNATYNVAYEKWYEEHK